MMEQFNNIAPWEWVQLISFYAIAAVMVLGALFVVTMKNIFHAALSLAVVAMGAAVVYLMLDAEFLGFVQIMVYVGAVITLIAFVVMLTQRANQSGDNKATNHQKFISFVSVGTVLALLLWKIPNASWLTTVTNAELANAHTIGNALLTDYLLPFEAVSVLLLAVLIGAIVLSRREKPAKDDGGAE